MELPRGRRAGGAPRRGHRRSGQDHPDNRGATRAAFDVGGRPPESAIQAAVNSRDAAAPGGAKEFARQADGVNGNGYMLLSDTRMDDALGEAERIFLRQPAVQAMRIPAERGLRSAHPVHHVEHA